MNDYLEKLKDLRDACIMQQAKWENELIEVGDFTYGEPIVLLWEKKTRLKIGKFCSIGGNVQILLGGEHQTDAITTYPFDVLMDEKPTPSKGDVTIGNDVWIGNNVQILSGVKIGDGAVIGAGSVVTKDVRPFSIVAGNPAKFIRFRYAAHYIHDVHWWDWPLEKIAEAIPLLMTDNIMALLQLNERWEHE